MGNKLQLVAIGVSILTVLIIVYTAFLIPPNIFMEIGISSAAHGKAKVATDYSKITLLSYPVERSDPITFQVKIVNDGGRSIKDLFVKMDFQPRDPNWLNPGNVPIQTQNYLPCSLASANACHIGIIPKGESVILEFVGSINPQLYGEVVEENPRIIFSYWFEGSDKIEKTVMIELAGYR